MIPCWCPAWYLSLTLSYVRCHCHVSDMTSLIRWYSCYDDFHKRYPHYIRQFDFHFCYNSPPPAAPHPQKTTRHANTTIANVQGAALNGITSPLDHTASSTCNLGTISSRAKSQGVHRCRPIITFPGENIYEMFSTDRSSQEAKYLSCAKLGN